MNEKINKNDYQTKDAITARIDKYGFLKFMDKVFADAYERDGIKQLNIEEYGLQVHIGYPLVDGKKPTIKRIDGVIVCSDYPNILSRHPELVEIYEACEKL